MSNLVGALALVPSEHGFNFFQYPYELLVATGMVSDEE